MCHKTPWNAKIKTKDGDAIKFSKNKLKIRNMEDLQSIVP